MKDCGDSLERERGIIQSQGEGEIPISPLQFRVYECGLQEIRNFIEQWHYSKSVNGISARHCYKLCDNDNIVGACIFGRMAMCNQYRKYHTDESRVIELRRLCCIDATPRNTESYFISKCIKFIRRQGYDVIVSYADPTHGHTGIIYRASNFKFIGRTSPGKVILYDGKVYHDHAIRTKYKGKLKPFAERCKQALLNGKATYQRTEGKYIYVYKLSKGESRK